MKKSRFMEHLIYKKVIPEHYREWKQVENIVDYWKEKDTEHSFDRITGKYTGPFKR